MANQTVDVNETNQSVQLPDEQPQVVVADSTNQVSVPATGADIIIQEANNEVSVSRETQIVVVEQSTIQTVNVGVAEVKLTTWGSITGTLTNQTDLVSALDLKYDASNPDGFISDISGQDLSTADNSTSAFITLADIPATTPGGTDKMMQFNDGGVFGGAVEVYWNKTEKKMKMLTGSTFELYNTADITTNYERATLKYTSNQLQLTSEAGGTGTARGLLMILPNGAVTIGSSTTANTNKTGRFFIPHYNTSEEAGFVFGGTITSTSYLLDIGGGSSSANTVTQGRLWAASNNTTLTGTQVATWDVSRFIHNSGMNYKVTRISSATHTVASNEHLLYVDYTTTGTVAVNLPAFASTRDGQEYVIADTGGNASANNITITPAGSNTIGLAGSKVISTNGGSVTIKGDNSKTNWIITSSV